MVKNRFTRTDDGSATALLLSAGLISNLCLPVLAGTTDSDSFAIKVGNTDMQQPEKLSKEQKKELKMQERLQGGKPKDSDEPSSADPHSAPCISWIDPVVPPKICLLCIHGLGLYSGSYTSFGKWMARHGVATYAIDVRGFGSWMKIKGEDNVDFPACLNDIKTTLTSIRAANPGLPVYILGESMGGAISLKAAALYPELIDGLVSSVPAGSRFKQKKTDLKVALEFLTGPNKQHDMGHAVVAQATDSEKMRADWENNPMDRMNFSAKQLIQFQKFMNENHEAAKLIAKAPLLMLQGNQDTLVKPEGTWELFNEVASPDKMFLAVPSEHLIFEEQQDHQQKFDERVSRLTLAWFQTHLPANYKWNDPSNPADHTNAMVKLFNNDFAGAKRELDAAIAANPTDSKSFFLRGLAETKLNQPIKARMDYAKAVALGHGSDSSKNANDFLMTMLQNPKQPSAAPASTAAKVVIDSAILDTLGVTGKPAILAFYAPWAEQCQDIDKTATQGLLRNIQFCKVNVEDASMAGLVKACSVGPIPTFVYLTKDGAIGSTSIGMNNFTNFVRQIKIAPVAVPAKAVPAKAAPTKSAPTETPAGK